VPLHPWKTVYYVKNGGDKVQTVVPILTAAFLYKILMTGAAEARTVKCSYNCEREIWLSPVIQATWEARTVEWLEVQTLLLGSGRISGSALWASTLSSGPEVTQRSK
jgi:hypothetical protein